ncbi:MAG: type II toxin-antitoxin system HicB family antitoxin [Acidobacteriota bacterium]
MINEFTAVYVEEDGGFVAFVEELAGANTQGSTLEEARENLREAIELILDCNREQARLNARGEPHIREILSLNRP